MIFTEFSEFTESWLNPKKVWLPGTVSNWPTCTLPVAGIKIIFPSPALARYLLPLTPVNSYLTRCSWEIFTFDCFWEYICYQLRCTTFGLTHFSLNPANSARVIWGKLKCAFTSSSHKTHYKLLGRALKGLILKGPFKSYILIC